MRPRGTPANRPHCSNPTPYMGIITNGGTIMGQSDDEKKGVDNGPCKSFTPMLDSDVRCQNCGYLRASHR